MKKTSVFKKAFCVILAIAVLAVGVPFTAIAAANDETNFAIVSDIHYFAKSAMGSTEEDVNEFRDMMFLNNSTSGISPEITETAMATLTDMALAGEIEFLLIPGDITKNAEYSAHVEFSNRLKAFELTTGVPVYVINGNHDINNRRAAYYDGENLIDGKHAPDMRDTLDTTPEEFETIYHDFGYSPEGGYYNRYKPSAENSEGSLSYATDVADNYRLIAIDAQLYSADNTESGENEQETAGKISENLMNWILDECAKANSDGKTIIGLMHTNAIPHFETETDLFQAFVVNEWEKFADKVTDAGMHYIVTGHVHMQDVATYINDNGEKLTDITSTSLLSYPNQFRTAKIKTSADGKTSLTYNSHDVDEKYPVVIDGVPQPRPFKYKTWEYNFGGTNIKNFVMNLLEYQLDYGFGKDVKNAGGLYYYLNNTIGFEQLITELSNNEALGSIGESAIRLLLFSVCKQLEDAYLTDTDSTLAIVEPMIDKILSVEVSDYPCTAFRNTLGFYSSGSKGTVGDLASTVLAYHYTNNENPENDKFLNNALDRFNNGENAEAIVDTLLDVILNDLLQNTILKDINIDLISLGINSEDGSIMKSLAETVSNVIGEDALPKIGISDVISVILLSGIAGGENLSDVVYSILDEYLTKSQYDVIDGEFYRILKDFTYDTNPVPRADLSGTATNSRASVPLSQDNLRLPSHIAVTFGEDSATTRNISYFTKYSITNTDIQIVPYSNNPDFSHGTTVNVQIDTECEENVEREYSSIDLSFIGIITHKTFVNRHIIKLSGLKPGTKYCYRVGDASRGWWSETGVIDTVDNSNTLSFLHVTDPQSVTEKQYAENWALTLNTAFNNHNPDFIVNTGDLVDNGGDFVEWKRMFNSASKELMSTALMSASGNHEARGDFALVNNFVFSGIDEQDTVTGVYYSFDYNIAHIAILNSNELNSSNGLSDEQIEWLKNDMNSSDKPWKFVALHKAPYSNGSHFDDKDVEAIRAQLQTLMPELGIDLVLQGHDHVFMRTDVMNNNAVVETKTQTLVYNGLEYTSKINPDGTIYSINGTAGSKHYEPKPAEETANSFPSGETVISIDIPSYSYIQIDRGNLYFDSYGVNADGTEERLDSFAISKVVTLPDGTVIDGSSGNTVVDSNNGNDANDIIADNIANTFRNNNVHAFLLYILIAFAGTTALITTVVIVKRRKEEI